MTAVGVGGNLLAPAGDFEKVREVAQAYMEKFKQSKGCRYMGKVVTLGEIMLRLSTPVGIRVAQTENFAVHYGGGEANVAISLANYGHQVTFASKVPDNSLGEAAKSI